MSLFVHAHAAARIEAAMSFVGDRPGAGLVVVGATIDAARDFAAEVVLSTGQALEVETTTLDRLALRLARPALARAGLGVASRGAIETAIAQAVATLADGLPRFGPLRTAPGLPRAIASTLDELWAADVPASALVPHDPELAAIASGVARRLEAEKLATRARVLELAIEALAEGGPGSVLLLDVPLGSRLEGELAQALLSRAERALFVAPLADTRTLGRLSGWAAEADGTSAPPLARAAGSLFGAHDGVPSEEVHAIAARGESAEATELARLALEAARAGTPLHRIAIVLRRPELARAPIEAAFDAAQIPIAFSRGARRPEPSGRAFLALLGARLERLSARAFAEYLSYGALPATATGAPPEAAAPGDRYADDEDDDLDRSEGEPEADHAVRAGALRAPRSWERLLGEAVVVGGDAARWARRLDGLDHDYARRIAELERSGNEAWRERQTREELGLLRRFALPLVEALAALPDEASLGTYREALAALATRALARPERVLSVLSELAPRVGAGETLTLGDLVRVLAPRLSAIEVRQGVRGVRVVTPDDLRGAVFDVVLVPGLVERSFPARVLEDPLLPDTAREAISPELATAHVRAGKEKLALALCVGAARERVVGLASIASGEGRPRVPSAYFAELLGRRLGRVARAADVRAAMSDAVRSVAEPARASRTTERNLALVRALAARPVAETQSAAHHVVLGEPLVRAALGRAWRRRQPRLNPSDGLLLPRDRKAEPLAAYAPAARTYSATKLESFATCPYRFYLSAVMHLEPLEEPTPAEEVDPLTRGSITHDAQFRTLLALRTRGVALGPAGLPTALDELDRVIATLREEQRELLVPAIPAVLDDAIETIRLDLREWLARLAAEPEWRPRYVELGFGSPPGDRDPESVAAPVTLEEGLTLRGAIDLVEERADGALRATDTKTGSTRTIESHVRGQALVVRGGQTLQPVLYALVLSRLFPERQVVGGRLWFATRKSGFATFAVALDDTAREGARHVASALEEACAKGYLPAVPVAGACSYCDHRLLCGPSAEARARAVPETDVREALPALSQLRRRP